MAQASIKIKDEIHEKVDSRLVQGKANSVWYRYSAETIMAVAPVLDEILGPYQYEDRQELIEATVRKKVNRRKDEVGNGNDH